MWRWPGPLAGPRDEVPPLAHPRDESRALPVILFHPDTEIATIDLIFLLELPYLTSAYMVTLEYCKAQLVEHRILSCFF